MKTVIIVSPYFPPSTLAGVHRARHLAKHLPKHGWRPVIVRVDERLYEENKDPGLASLVPEGLIQVRTGAIPTRIARSLGVGDLGLRAFVQLGSQAARAAEEYGAQAILITGSPFYPMLLTAYLKRRTGLPVVQDFQDPWLSAAGASRTIFSKGWVAHKLAALLEPKVIRNASFITSVSELQNEQLRSRYRYLDPARMAAIAIGGDPEDLIVAERNPPATLCHELETGFVNFSYIGNVAPRSGPLVRALFHALKQVMLDRPHLAARIRMNFVGSSNQASDRAGDRVSSLARELGVDKMVRETPKRVPYLEALALTLKSDVLLMIGSDEPHYTASKIYGSLMAKRPFLSLFHRGSSAHQILTEAGGGEPLSFTSVAELPALVSDLAKAIIKLAEQPASYTPASTLVFEQYTADRIAARYAAILDSLAAT